MKSFAGCSSFVEDWCKIPVQLYIDYNVKMKGDIVGGVRINKNAPMVRKELAPDTPAWTNAIAAYHRDGNLDAVKKRMDVSPENEAKLIEENPHVA